MKRELLERAVAADPEPDEFETWLHEQCLAAGGSEGGVRAMALSIFEEWRLAHDADAFRDWLARGAPSDDALTECRRGKDARRSAYASRISQRDGPHGRGVRGRHPRAGLAARRSPAAGGTGPPGACAPVS